MRLYSEGVQDRNYYLAAFTAVQQCIGIAEAVKQQQPNQKFGKLRNFRMIDGIVKIKYNELCDITYTWVF